MGRLTEMWECPRPDTETPEIISGLNVNLDETGSEVGLDIDRASKRLAA
jgi:hypothetical protein